MEWSQVRALFPAASSTTYVNAAELPPASALALAAAQEHLDLLAQQGAPAYDHWDARREQVRAQVASLLGAEPAQIGFTANTSHGMNLVADRLRGRGEVLSMADEFPSTTLPWLHRGDRLRLLAAEDHRYSIERIADAIDERTGVVVTSLVQFCTGFRQDLAALGDLCRDRGVALVVNATQGVVATPIDLRRTPVDFMVFTGLKWPCAGFGVGVLYVHPRWLDPGRAPAAGWMSVEDPETMDNLGLTLRADVAAVTELGCPAFPNIFALGGALEMFEQIGLPRAQQRIRSLTSRLADGLRSIGASIISPWEPEHRSGIVVVDVAEPQRVVAALRERQIICSTVRSRLRISPHVYNDEADIDRLVAGLARLLP
ncbi:MAG: aminotransferase class V-fold PLP-dependent enzyme [Myxococcota bacterium]